MKEYRETFIIGTDKPDQTVPTQIWLEYDKCLHILPSICILQTHWWIENPNFLIFRTTAVIISDVSIFSSISTPVIPTCKKITSFSVSFVRATIYRSEEEKMQIFRDVSQWTAFPFIYILSE